MSIPRIILRPQETITKKTISCKALQIVHFLSSQISTIRGRKKSTTGIGITLTRLAIAEAANTFAILPWTPVSFMETRRITPWIKV